MEANKEGRINVIAESFDMNKESLQGRTEYYRVRNEMNNKIIRLRKLNISIVRYSILHYITK